MAETKQTKQAVQAPQAAQAPVAATPAVPLAPSAAAPALTRQGMSTGAKVAIGVGVGCCVIILGIIGLLVVFFGWAIFTGDFSGTTKTPTPTRVLYTPTPSVIPTKSLTGFVPYSNCKYRYSLQYPNGWADKPFASDAQSILISNDGVAMGLYAFDNSKGLTLDEFIAAREKIIKGTRGDIRAVTFLNTPAKGAEYSIEGGSSMVVYFWLEGNSGMQLVGSRVSTATDDAYNKLLNTIASLRANVDCAQ